MTKPSLQDLENAAEIVYRHISPTPQICWPLLSERLGSEVWVKHENHTPIGAFKIRGGLVYMDALKKEHKDITGVITATRGNHGQSVALAAGKAGLKAVVVVPRGNNPEKNAAMRALGAELVEYGGDFQESYEHAIAMSSSLGLHPIQAFDEMLVRGVASYSLEFLRAVEDLDTVYLPIGQGSGICGMIRVRDALNSKTRIVGVVSEVADCYAKSFEQRNPVSTNSADTLADGIACRTPDETALKIILKGAERVVRVSEESILDAMGCYFSDTHNLAEGAGAAPLAALLNERKAMEGKRVGLILSGGNVDKELYLRMLKRIG